MTEEQKAGKILLFCKETSQERIMKRLRDAFDVPGNSHDAGLELHNGNLDVTINIYCESAGVPSYGRSIRTSSRLESSGWAN